MTLWFMDGFNRERSQQNFDLIRKEASGCLFSISLYIHPQDQTLSLAFLSQKRPVSDFIQSHEASQPYATKR
jgi:hypothetical protein